MENNTQPNTGFKQLLNSMMTRRWLMTLIVLITLLLLLGAFIGSYGKIIDYWFSDTDKDKMLVQKMDEEDGVSLSNTNSTEG
jgi:hypothetical protein